MDRFPRLSELLQRFIEKGPAGCSCIIAQGNEVVYEQSFGYADLETKRPIRPDTIFRIYSMTKIITCTAALMLYERGLYLLNDPLEEYLPEFSSPQVYRYSPTGVLTTSPAAGPIRIKDLFTMTSGLTYGGDKQETARTIAGIMQQLRSSQENGETLNVRDLTKALSAAPLAFDPGTHWQYGFSHDILGALIEIWSGKSLGQFLKEELFDPLGMEDTFFRIPDDKLDRLCSMYDRTEDGTLTKNTRMDANYQPGALFESGGGGLLSTTTDYIRFARMLTAGGTWEGKQFLSSHTLRLMTTNHLGTQQLADYHWPQQAGYGYGLGVRVMIDPPAGGSNSNPGEFGWSGMAGSWTLMDPEAELSVVYMQQLLPNLESYHHPRMRNVIYGSL
ncbi:serine hydrolase domain-containing protein [Paenibacillus rigui]|uniref:Serine hydrolase n=1 Tax=Paenibacillus rigui TaxID=554312 RepID=A0A229UGM6_9BACL|nr:serine hydrolase domain-containing protein [Paenibacillus rigui]OXM82543.1 serine hydrolase [Paenibacillus rigui]